MEETVWEAAFEEQEQPSIPSLDLMGLLELGSLNEEIDIYGRKVLLKTLTIGEQLEVALLTKDYIGTSEELMAICAATVAASIVTIDGNPMIMEIGPNESLLALKFRFVRENLYWTIIRLVYQEYLDLSERAEEALKEIKKN